MKKLTFFMVVLLALPSFSASVIKQARESLKKRQNLEQTAKSLLELAVKEETPRKVKIECYQLAAECSQRINDTENSKLYLKQAYDTTKYFTSMWDMTERLLLADSVGTTPDEKGRIRPVNRKRNRELLLRYRPNLLAGANWFYRRVKNEQAYNLFDTYISLAKKPILAADSLIKNDTLIPPAAYLAVTSAYQSGKFDGVIHYADLAKTAGLSNETVQELVVKAWDAKRDTARWESALWKGVREYPRHAFFFTRLIDHLYTNGELDKCMSVIDSMLIIDHREPLFWYAKSMVYMKQHNDHGVIAACDSCLALDSNYVDACYNKSIATLNLAVIAAETACQDLRDPECRRQQDAIKALYRMAMVPMERVRQLQPERTERWAAPLYRIYVNLNMGKEFGEIDDILNKR